MPFRPGLVKHLACLLQQEEHLNSCYPAADVALAIGVIADASNNEAVTIDVDASLIRTSFQYGNNNESKVLLENLGLGTEDNKGFFLLVKRHRGGPYEEWKAEIGCYNSESICQLVKTVSRFNIGYSNQESLVQWLEAESSKRDKTKARKRKSEEKHEAAPN